MGSPTFAGATQTPNAAFDPSKDNVTPQLRLLNLKAMPSTTALGGTTGVEASLVHADEWNQIEGNLTENVLKNWKATITQNETHTIDGNLIHRVVGTTNDTRVDVHNQTNIAPRNDTFMHSRTEIHYQPEHREQKTVDNDVSETLREFWKEHFELNWFKTDAFLTHFEFNAMLNFEKKMFNVAGNIFSMEGQAVEVEMKEITTSLGALATEIKAGKIKAAGSHLKAIAGNINAGIALNADSPFG